MIDIKAHANCDHAIVAWVADKPIEKCLGFALYRKRTGGAAEIVDTFVGPSTEKKVPAGTRRPSTTWPIQKFTWADYLVQDNGEFTYQVAAMCGDDFDHMAPGEKSGWSNTVSLATPPDAAIQPYFNRGVVSTQWMARRLQQEKKPLETLVNPAPGTTNETRDFLGGVLKTTLLDLLESQCKAGAHIYASIFELNDPEVVPAIAKFGQRAHVILSDGTHAAPASAIKAAKAAGKTLDTPYDENADARKVLQNAHIELHNRMVGDPHFAHHKFIVFTSALNTTEPVAVWTGSTNLTYGGVCTQANNAVLIKDATIASAFFQQWKRITNDINNYPAALVQSGATPMVAKVGAAKVTAWFAPNPRIGPKPKKGENQYGDHPDIKCARELIQGAQHGVLFLVLDPGYAGTLLNVILDLLDDPAAREKLFIHGVANTDPTGGQDKAPLIFVHRNAETTTSAAIERAIVLPAAIAVPAAGKDTDKQAAAALQAWVKRIDDYWQTEPTGLGIVRVHSKVVVVDPFGGHPVVITGSHNLGPKASAANDDNLVIVENDPATAAQYAVNIMGVYDQYRWAFLQHQAAANHTPLNQWNGLAAPWSAQASYFKGDKAKELKFWM